MARKVELEDFNLRDGFLFLGGHVVLDFLNTRPVIAGEAKELLPDFSAWLRWLLAAELIGEQDAPRVKKFWTAMGRSPHNVAIVRGLRETLRKDILVWEQGGPVRPQTVKRLNWFLGKYPMETRLRPRGKGLDIERWCAPAVPNSLLGPLGHWAADLFANVDPSRVRQCDNCVLHFYDTSKKGLRRWCSMEICGNRYKVAAYAKRRRASAEVTRPRSPRGR